MFNKKYEYVFYFKHYAKNETAVCLSLASNVCSAFQMLDREKIKGFDCVKVEKL